MEGCADVSRAGFNSRPWRQGGLAHGPVHSFLLFSRAAASARGLGGCSESHPPGFYAARHGVRPGLSNRRGVQIPGAAQPRNVVKKIE